jgi:hypothetical protein
MGIAVHYTHLALVVMVMDLCFNKNEADEAEIKVEVKTALQMFEGAKTASPLLPRFLTSLSDVLKKHKVNLSNPLTLATNTAAGFAHDIMLDGFNRPSDDDQMDLEIDVQDSSGAFDTSFDEFWQIVMQGESNSDSRPL